MNRKEAAAVAMATIAIGGAVYLVIREDVFPINSPVGNTIIISVERESLIALATKDIGKNMRDIVWQEVNPALKGNPNYCGGWVLYKLRQAGLTNATWTMGLGFIYKLKLPITRDPKPGDIAYWHSPRQHYGMVVETNPLVTVDGAQNKGLVRLVRSAEQENRPTPLFYSIEKLL